MTFRSFQLTFHFSGLNVSTHKYMVINTLIMVNVSTRSRLVTNLRVTTEKARCEKEQLNQNHNKWL